MDPANNHWKSACSIRRMTVEQALLLLALNTVTTHSKKINIANLGKQFHYSSVFQRDLHLNSPYHMVVFLFVPQTHMLNCTTTTHSTVKNLQRHFYSRTHFYSLIFKLSKLFFDIKPGKLLFQCRYLALP